MGALCITQIYGAIRASTTLTLVKYENQAKKAPVRQRWRAERNKTSRRDYLYGRMAVKMDDEPQDDPESVGRGVIPNIKKQLDRPDGKEKAQARKI